MAIMAMASVAQAKMPDDVKQKVDAIKASVQSKIEQRGNAKVVKTAIGDKILKHDGVRVLDILDIGQFQEMSFPAGVEVFVGNDNQIKAEIKKLKLK